MSQFDPIHGNQSFGMVNSVFSGNIADLVNSNVNISNNMLGNSNSLSSKGETMFINIPLSAVHKIEGYSPTNLRLIDDAADPDNSSFPYYASPNQDRIIGSTVPVSTDGLPTTADDRLMKIKFDFNNPTRNTIIYLKQNLEAYGPNGEVAPLLSTSPSNTQLQTGAYVAPVAGDPVFDLNPSPVISNGTNTAQINMPGGATNIAGSNTANVADSFPGAGQNNESLIGGQGLSVANTGVVTTINQNQEVVFVSSINGGQNQSDVLSGRTAESGIKLTLYYCYWEDLFTNF